MTDAKAPLQEGKDFYFENGLLILTSDYLKRRGDCCGSGCRNCPYNKTKVVSMVPSWTETLIEAGSRVVARTRFCVHPRERVLKIPAVGGTKDIQWNKIEGADLLILDQEENPKSMSEEATLKWIATHVSSNSDVSRELRKIADALGEDQSGNRLRDFAKRWEKVLSNGPKKLSGWSDLPGVIDWVRRPSSNEISNYVYLIWKNPWMAVGSNTFIASQLSSVGLPDPGLAEKYPVVALEALPRDTVLLCSTEPFPFAKKREELLNLNRPVALIDGEAFSWFGVRSLRFLEELSEAHSL